MPCPESSRTTENPAPSATCCTACETSGEAIALLALLDGGVQEERTCTLLEQAALRPDLAHSECEGRVGDESLQRDADVRSEDVALLERVVARDAVDDHVVRRQARGGRIAAVAP